MGERVVWLLVFLDPLINALLSHFTFNCRPKQSHTLDPNFSTRSSPKKHRQKCPDYISEITAPLAKEEDFDFMVYASLLSFTGRFLLLLARWRQLGHQMDLM